MRHRDGWPTASDLKQMKSRDVARFLHDVGVEDRAHAALAAYERREMTPASFPYIVSRCQLSVVSRPGLSSYPTPRSANRLASRDGRRVDGPTGAPDKGRPI